MFASLSIYGLWEYDNTIFDNLALPSGMDKDIMTAEILSECSDFCLLYPNHDFMKMLIGVWSQKELHIWEKMWESENITYNPIENYDRHESVSRVVESATDSDTGGSSTSGNTSRSKDTASKTGFDSDTLKTVAGTEASSDTTAVSSSRESASARARGTEVLTTHTHGNIGVTTAAQMIQGFRDVSDFCTYDFILQSFKDRFCLQVY